jgi:hypothetical protein
MKKDWLRYQNLQQIEGLLLLLLLSQAWPSEDRLEGVVPGEPLQ